MPSAGGSKKHIPDTMSTDTPDSTQSNRQSTTENLTDGEILEAIEARHGTVESFIEENDRINDAIAEMDLRVVRDRPAALTGRSQRIKTGYGKLYVTINNDDNGEPFEVITNIGSSGGFTNGFTEAVARLATLSLRAGVPVDEVIDQIRGIHSPKIATDQGDTVMSIPDAIGQTLERHQKVNENSR